MQIQTDINVINNVCIVQVGLSTGSQARPLTLLEQQAFAEFGEPGVECGGQFSAGELTFTLPSNTCLMPSQFPVQASFSGDDNPSDFEARAALYKSTLITRMTAARDAVLTRSAGTIGRNVITV